MGNAEPAAARAAFDLARIDSEAFYRDVRALRAELEATAGAEDAAHLRKMERWGRACTAIGLATAWIAPNPVSAAALALGKTCRWMLMHHVGHRGYDRVPGDPPRRTSKGFARGKRRFLDWCDWMTPAAWIYEHNVLHHACTGEPRDPDQLERNLERFHASKLPRAAKTAFLALFPFVWKPAYYAPSTMRTWARRREGASDAPHRLPTPWKEIVLRCYLPYAALNFVLLPALFLPLGPGAAASVFLNLLLAEALTNLHTFLIVGPNHAGDDLYAFDGRAATKAEACVRQVVASANYRTGTDRLDFLQAWLNYQIEHHVWPDLTMLQYRHAQPRLRALCEKHSVPYAQEPIAKRWRKLAAVLTGRARLRRVPTDRP
jgi:fatty acid desaturase